MKKISPNANTHWICYSTTFLTNPSQSKWDRWATNWKLVQIIYKVSCETCETKKSFLVTIDLWYASKLLEKNDFLAKSRTLLEIMGLYQLKSCFRQKELQNSFTCMTHAPSIVEEHHLQAIVFTMCHIFLPSVHVQNYLIDEFGIVSLYRFLWLHTPKFKQLLFIVWMVYIWRL